MTRTLAYPHPCMGTVKRERRSGSKLLAPHAPIEGSGSRVHERHALSLDSFFVRPGAVSSSRPESFSEAPRAAAVKAGRRWVVTTSCVVARPRLDGSEHGARVARSGGIGQPDKTADLAAIVERAVKHLVHQLAPADHADAPEIDQMIDLFLDRPTLAGSIS